MPEAEKKEVAPSFWLVITPDYGSQEVREFPAGENQQESFQEALAAANEWVIRRKLGKYHGAVHLFHGWQVTVEDPKYVYRVDAPNIGKFDMEIKDGPSE